MFGKYQYALSEAKSAPLTISRKMLRIGRFWCYQLTIIQTSTTARTSSLNADPHKVAFPCVEGRPVPSARAAIVDSPAAFAHAPVAKTTPAVHAFRGELAAAQPPPLIPSARSPATSPGSASTAPDASRSKRGRISQLAFLGQVTTHTNPCIRYIAT
jgi:hypothetical protein